MVRARYGSTCKSRVFQSGGFQKFRWGEKARGEVKSGGDVNNQLWNYLLACASLMHNQGCRGNTDPAVGDGRETKTKISL